MNTPHPCIALIPVRDFRTGKSRLSDILSGEERVELGKWMLERVLGAAGAASEVDKIAVISNGESVLSIARKKGAAGIECPARDLNKDLELGRKWAIEQGARAILIVPADLPALEPPDIDAMIARGAESRHSGGCAVLAPSPDGGTNGMLLRPADGVPFMFGPDSFMRHGAAVRAAGFQPVSFENSGFGLDVDTPSDLAALTERGIPLPDWLAAISLP